MCAQKLMESSLFYHTQPENKKETINGNGTETICFGAVG